MVCLGCYPSCCLSCASMESPKPLSVCGPLDKKKSVCGWYVTWKVVQLWAIAPQKDFHCCLLSATYNLKASRWAIGHIGDIAEGQHLLKCLVNNMDLLCFRWVKKMGGAVEKRDENSTLACTIIWPVLQNFEQIVNRKRSASYFFDRIFWDGMIIERLNGYMLNIWRECDSVRWVCQMKAEEASPKSPELQNSCHKVSHTYWISTWQFAAFIAQSMLQAMLGPTRGQELGQKLHSTYTR